MRLLSTPQELAQYTGDAREVWLIRETERFPLLPEPGEVWGERLRGSERVFLSEDGRVEVLRIELAPPPQSPSASAGRLSPGSPAHGHRTALPGRKPRSGAGAAVNRVPHPRRPLTVVHNARQ